MQTRHPRRPTFRRTLARGLLLMVMLMGMVINPVLAVVGDIHDLDHAAVSSSGNGHAHVDDHSHDPPASEGENDSAEGEGWHGLLHLSHGCAPSTAACASTLLAFVPLMNRVDSPFAASLAPLKRVSEPFRPPIS